MICFIHPHVDCGCPLRQNWKGTWSHRVNLDYRKFDAVDGDRHGEPDSVWPIHQEDRATVLFISVLVLSTSKIIVLKPSCLGFRGRGMWVSLRRRFFFGWQMTFNRSDMNKFSRYRIVRKGSSTFIL